LNTATVNSDTDVIIEQDGQPTAVVLSYQRYVALQEEIEDLEDAVAALETELRIARGEERVLSWDEANTKWN
jgi:prevent-host-death family protein